MEDSRNILEFDETGTIVIGCKDKYVVTEIVIPDGVTSIGDGAFYGCTSLTAIEIPNSVTRIGNDVFGECSSLTTIEIPNSVACIGVDVFYDCTGLTSIIVESDNHIFDSRENSNAIIETDSNMLIAGCKNTVIPNNVTSIGNGAFRNCTSLISIEIPNSVTSIGRNAFRGCTSLPSIEIPNSVINIGLSAFYGCTGFTSIEIPNSVTSIGHNVFSNCSRLSSIIVDSSNPVYDSRNNCNAIIETDSNELVAGCKNTTIPNSVTFINWAFSNCSGLTSINIPNSVKTIWVGAFSGCTALTSIEIPNSVTIIGKQAFEDCTSLTSIEIPNGVKDIGEEAFSNCSGLTSIKVSNSVKNIGEGAFWGCTDLLSIIVERGNRFYNSHNNCNAIIETTSNVLIVGCRNTTIPTNVTSIENHAFYGCIGLTSIEIPNSVTNIGDGVFDGCTSLTSIEIPNSVTNIGDGAFKDCNSLTSIEIPNSVTNIEKLGLHSCNSLKAINTQSNPRYHSAEGVIYSKEKKVLIIMPRGKTGEYIVAPETETIGEDAFWKSALEIVRLSENINRIDYGAFREASIKELHFRHEHPEKLVIGKDAFKGLENCTLYVPIGTGYAYRHHPAFAGKFKEVIIER